MSNRSQVKTLVVLPNWVGDTVMALPVLQALGRSDRFVAALARPHLVPLLSTLPAIDDAVSGHTSDAETVGRIRDARFDEAVILPNSFRSAWLALRAGVPRRWGYGGRSLEGWLRSAILSPAVRASSRRHHHQVEDYVDLLAAMAVAPPPDWTPRLPISAELDRVGRELLDRARIEQQRGPLIGLFPGAEFGPSKRWPWRRFAELSRELRKSARRSRQVILAGPREVWLAVRIHEESGKIHPVIGPDLDLGKLAAALAQLDLLVTNDSGPMHLAAALGVPCLAVFGPTNPRRTRPFGAVHEVVYRDRWCSPCFQRRCPLLHHRCLREITVDDVLRRALGMLEAGAAG